MEWQCNHPKYPLRYFDEEYYRHPCGLLWARNLDNSSQNAVFERQHKNSYMYWYNKVKKLQKEAFGSDKLAAVEVAFETFKAGNMERKTVVKGGKMPEKEYTDWLYKQQAVIDGLMQE